MQFSAIEYRFIVKTKLNSAFTNDLKRKEIFSKNVQSYRLCSFNEIGPRCHIDCSMPYVRIFLEKGCRIIMCERDMD